MVLLVPGMVDPKLPQGVLLGSAYGDLLAAALALASIIALRSNWPSAIPLVWVFNTLGFLDLLNVLRSVLQIDLPTYYLGSIWFIYTFYAPLVIVSHVMIFVILLNPRSWKNAEIAQ
jgi:hypothetical protein